MYLPEGHRGCCTGSLKGARAGKLDSQVLSGWGLPAGPSARRSEHRQGFQSQVGAGSLDAKVPKGGPGRNIQKP